jgi:OOP family OmpA-OmpF porin
MSAKQVIAALALSAIAAASAQAADFYIGASGGTTDWKVADEPGASIDKSDTGYKFMLGAQFHPNFALEGGYVDLGKAKYSGAYVGDIKGTGWFVDAVGLWPMSPQWTLLGKVGVFNGKAKGTVVGLGSASDSGTDAKFGLGVQYSLSKNLALRGEWERYRFDVFNDKGDVDLWSLGVKFSF